MAEMPFQTNFFQHCTSVVTLVQDPAESTFFERAGVAHFHVFAG